jgi:hypothetical protein
VALFIFILARELKFHSCERCLPRAPSFPRALPILGKTGPRDEPRTARAKPLRPDSGSGIHFQQYTFIAHTPATA